MFDHNIMYIREQMFNHFTTHIKAMFDHNINIVLENKYFLFLARIKAMFDHYVVLENKM